MTERLAACANLLPQIDSLYVWQGKLEKGSETLVLFKTTAGVYEQFEARLRQLHPYDVPEVIATRIEHGAAPYLDWVREKCGIS